MNNKVNEEMVYLKNLFNATLEKNVDDIIFEKNDPKTWKKIEYILKDFIPSNYNICVEATDEELNSKTFHVDLTNRNTKDVNIIELGFDSI